MRESRGLLTGEGPQLATARAIEAQIRAPDRRIAKICIEPRALLAAAIETLPDTA